MSRRFDFGTKEEVVSITCVIGGRKLLGRTKGDRTKRGEPRKKVK